MRLQAKVTRLSLLLLIALLGNDLRAADLTGYQSVRGIARQLGMLLQVREMDAALETRMYRDGVELRFTSGSRLFTLNGMRVYLGFPVLASKGRPYIYREDVEFTLLPLLLPHRISGERPPIGLIVLDPGHGDQDKGAVNTELDLEEKALNLQFAFLLRQRLEEKGFRVALTREDDRFIPLPERPKLAAELGGSLFLSLHFNGTTNPDTAGVETFVLTPPGHPSTSQSAVPDGVGEPLPGHRHAPWSVLLGYYLQRALSAELPSPDRGLKRARFAVLRDLNMPGALLEPGFLTHAEEAAMLADPLYQERIARAVVAGVEAYARTLQRNNQ